MQRARSIGIVHARVGARGMLPFELGGQTRPGPARERVGLVEAHVDHRLVIVDEAGTGQGGHLPLVVARGPVEGRLPRLLVRRVPTIGEPERRCGVSAIVDECAPLATGDETIGDLERVEPDLVDGSFVVEREARSAVADLDDAAGVVEPLCRLLTTGHPAHVGTRGVRGLSVLMRQHVLDVHQKQFLVLLFVVEAKFDERVDHRGVRSAQQPLHRMIDMCAIRADLLDTGSAHEPTLIAWPAITDGLVVRIEQVRERRVEHAVRRHVRHEHERLEEPGGVGPVPFCRAHVGHRLDCLVLGAEWRGEVLGEGADRVVSP